MTTMTLSRGFTADIQKWVFASEGGYVDHPADPGGATNLGITHKVLAAWRGISPWQMLSKDEIRKLTKVEAAKIYEKNYWNAIRGNSLPLGLDYALLDYAINSGVNRAGKEIQRVVAQFYKGNIDGIMGAMTLTAIKEYAETYGTPALILALCERRWAFVQGLKTFPTFGKGWSRRIWGSQMGIQAADIGVADRATMLANEQPLATIPEPHVVGPDKAEPEKPTVIDAIKDPGVLGGIATAVGTIIAAIADQPVLQVALVLGIGFLVYRFVIVKKQVDPA